MAPRGTPQGIKGQIGWLEPPAPPGMVRRSFRIGVLLVVVIISPVAGQGPGLELPNWLSADPATRTLTAALEVEGGGPEAPARLNGHHHGSLQLVVPLGWKVKWTWVNRDSASAHSLVVMAEREKLPLEGGHP